MFNLLRGMIEIFYAIYRDQWEPEEWEKLHLQRKEQNETSSYKNSKIDLGDVSGL